jgi:1-acyl-sn-glycerol-3-phosphate acyltransferase
MATCRCPSFVAKAAIKQVPFVGFLCSANQPVYVLPHHHGDGGSPIADQGQPDLHPVTRLICAHLQKVQANEAPPLLIFPGKSLSISLIGLVLFFLSPDVNLTS